MPAPAQATVGRRDSYLSVPGSANPSTKRFTSIRGEASREGVHETIYLPYADYFLRTYGSGMVFSRYLTVSAAVVAILQIRSFTPA